MSISVLHFFLLFLVALTLTNGPTVKWRIPAMIMTNMQVQPTPAANQADRSMSSNSSEQGSLYNRIVDIEAKILTEEAWSNGLNWWTIRLGILYMVVTLAFVIVSLLAIPAGNKLRADEKTLSGLLIEQEKQRTFQ